MSVVTVSSAAALSVALKSAHSGDTIQLASGTYSGVSISNLTFATGVTITSADPNHQAVVTDLAVTNVNGLSFTHIEFAEAGTVGYTISKSQNITFDHDYVHGSLNGNASDDASGLSFLDTSHVKVTNSEFTQLKTALGIGSNTLSQVSDITVSGNDFHGVEKAAMHFAGASNVSITHNYISDIRPVNGDHPDAIQFFTTGTTVAAQNIDIADNVITKGAGDATQGIFLRDQVGTLPYQNVTIENNLVVGTGYGGIYVMGVNGAKIDGNELVSDPGKTNNTWLLVQGGANVTSTDNSAQTISFSQVTNLTETGDVINGTVTDGGAADINAFAAAHHLDPAVATLALNAAAADVVSSVTTAFAVATAAAAAAPAAASTAVTATTPVAAASDPTTTTLGATVQNATLVDVNHTPLNVIGNTLANVITGNEWANNLQGMDGNDTLVGGAGNDTLVGGAGDDTYLDPSPTSVIIEQAGGGNDTVIAARTFTLSDNVENVMLDNNNAKDWNATGNSLNNIITGNSGNNVLLGLGGDDTINGGAGNDDITGGPGNDRLTGGAGNDVFRFSPGSGHDVITDFGANGDHDMLDISAFTKAGITSSMHEVGHDLVISFSNGDSITLLNDNAAMLKSWFAGWIT